MYKKIFYQSLIAGVLASIAGLIYNSIYFFATEVNFSGVLSTTGIIALNVMSCMVAGIMFGVSIKLLKAKGEILFNFLFSIVTFACVMIPISISLPLKIEMPELFPGLAVPMIFFPAMAWYTVNPLFKVSAITF